MLKELNIFENNVLSQLTLTKGEIPSLKFRDREEVL